MKTKKTIKQILVALGVAFGALVLYAVFSGGFQAKPSKGGVTGGLVSTQGKSTTGIIQETDVEAANAQILKVLGSVNKIELNDEILSNPIFRQLKDSRFSIPRPVRIGRPNPFAPIGVEFLSPEDGDGYGEEVVGGNTDTEGENGGTFFDSELNGAEY